MQRGCAGTLIDGAARDINEATGLGYPIFARSATPRTARGRTVELACQTPIQFAGVPINPGDYVIADSTGIVVVPQHSADDVIEAAAAIAANETLIASQIDSGTPITEAMGRTYEEFLT
jgi:regulator of RNase E activity RraA